MLLTNQECLHASSLLRLLVRAPFVLGDDARYQRVLDFLVQATCSANLACPVTQQEFLEFASKLVAHWIGTRQDDFFQLLLARHADIVASTVEHIGHKSALVRMACISAWNELISTEAEGMQAWQACRISYGAAYRGVHLGGLQHQCMLYWLAGIAAVLTHVMIAGCQLLSKVLVGKSSPAVGSIREQILDELGLVDALACYLYDEGEDGDAQALVALEFLWILMQTREQEAYRFLVESQLLFRYQELLGHPSKMVRAKLLDILEQGLAWWPEAHGVFGIDGLGKDGFLFRSEIVDGLQGSEGTIAWPDAARLAMLVCNCHRPLMGNDNDDDLRRSFYALLWCSSSRDALRTMNDLLEHSAFVVAERYKAWLQEIAQIELLLDSLFDIGQMDEHALLGALACVHQLYTCPTMLLADSLHARTRLLCGLAAHKRADVREIAVRILRCLLSMPVQMVETRQAIAMDVTTCEQLERALHDAIADSEVAVVLNAVDGVKMYLLLRYHQSDKPWSLPADLLRPLLAHHDALVRRLALQALLYLCRHERSITDRHDMARTVLDEELVEQLSRDDDWETRLAACHLLEQLWLSSIEPASLAEQSLFYLYSAERYLLRGWLDDMHLPASEVARSIAGSPATKRPHAASNNAHCDHAARLLARLDSVNWVQLATNTRADASDAQLLLEELGLAHATDDNWMPIAPVVDDCF
ncbi:hypothetical protein SYNPS1DRAFT_27071 [Syncephalis pseudoplumigaleata]|uniref:Armadillo-type protein n=1 Tax=Syncephalis pseudoplumigaleata TaxID=1712513 RepID=A0A4P9Z490_9FUNG|nr:hypothetical protein SYNPS1DRAFT_27071 [Syncephalis pseudoplumigaleata]|eukprot:RKP27265.1 hypothetical protein SYNPS1DRAFT_27071 [Syncephalis pseudoplumigaleata]